MTIVDTTVWIDFFGGTNTPEVQELQRLIDASEDVCICGVILTEVLQGIRKDKDHAAASAAFEAFLFLPRWRRVCPSGSVGSHHARMAEGLSLWERTTPKTGAGHQVGVENNPSRLSSSDALHGGGDGGLGCGSERREAAALQQQ